MVTFKHRTGVLLLVLTPAWPLRSPLRMSAKVAIGVDVGTGSARAGVVDVASGKLLGVHKQDIKMWEPLPEHYEQSSDDIWDAVCACTRGVCSEEITCKKKKT